MDLTRGFYFSFISFCDTGQQATANFFKTDSWSASTQQMTLHLGLDSFCADTKTCQVQYKWQWPEVAQVIHTCIKHGADAVGREGLVH